MSFGSNIMLQTQDLRVDQEKEPCIGFTQENSIESSIQECLSFILKAHGLHYVLLAYSKQSYIHLKVNICCICCMTLYLSRTFYPLFLCYMTNPNPKF